MPELTYELIAPLVVHTDVSHGTQVEVVFQCPVSGEQVKAHARITESDGSAIKKEVKRSLWRNIRWSLSRMMHSVFGYGVGGAIGSTLVETAGSAGEMSGYNPSKDEVKGAVVDAFRSVQNRFAWDATNNRFVSASEFRELQTEFAVLMHTAQITKQWDRAVLARMLAEVAGADGTLSEEERNLFHEFAREHDLDNLLDRAPLTKADLQETSHDLRQIMWLIAAAMAVTDQEYAAAEAQKLATFADGLNIPPHDQARGLVIAKEYVLDAALEAAYADGKLDRDEHAQVMDLAARLGISQDRADRLDARCRKRRGII